MKRVGGVGVFLHQLVVVLTKLWIACDVLGGLQIRENAERIQPAACDQIAVVERLAVVASPARRLAVVIDELIVVLDQMRRHVVDDLTHPRFFFGRLGDEVVVGCVQKVVAVEFVGASVALPVPLPVGAFGPTRRDLFPVDVLSRPHRPVALQIVIFVGIGTVDGAYRSRRKTFRRRIRSSLGDVA